MALSKELIAASSAPLVLSILSRGPSYGYALIQDVKARSGGFIEWTEGMLYPVLHRLEKDGAIEGYWSEGPGERRRRYYRITRAGKAALAKQREQWQAVGGTLSALWEGA